MNPDQELYHILEATQQADQAVRSDGESSLSAFLARPDAGLSLCRVALSQEAARPIRQMSALVLKKYVNQYWSAIFPQFIGPMTGADVKVQIRTMLLQALGEPDSKIRIAIAFALSSIANSDWPNDFPELLPGLFAILSPEDANKDQNAVHGAMRVLAEFVRSDIMEEQLLDLLKESMPVLLSVLRSPQTNFSTRSHCIKIFRTSSKTLYSMKDEHPAVVTQAMEAVLPAWIAALGEVLQKDLNDELSRDTNWDGINMRNEIFRTLTVLQSSFPRVLQPHLASFTQLSLYHLTTLGPHLNAYYLSTSASAPEPPSDPNPEDGQNAGIVDLGASILDFLTGISRARSLRSILVTRNESAGSSNGSGAAMSREQPTPILEGLVHEVVGWTRITREDAEVWADDPNAFVADEDDEADAYSLRTAGFDLLGSLLDKFQSTVARVLQASYRRRMEESNQLHQSGDADWWKPLEAALACVGSVADALLDMRDEESDEGVAESFDLENLFKEVVPNLLNSSDSPFLQGRAFVFASQYVLTLAETGISGQYLEAAVQALEAPGVESVVKISAIKTIRNFCRYIKPEEIQPLSLRIIGDLGPYLAEATEETLALVLETIRAVIGVDGSILDANSTQQIVQAILQVWGTNARDPVLTAIVEEVFETIASTPSQGVYDSLIATAMPPLSDILTRPPSPEDMSSTSVAVELVNAIMRGRKTDLGDRLGPSVWPALFHCMLTTEDSDAVQYGCNALTTFVRKSGPQLFAWQDATGRSGLDAILTVLARLIDPSFSESAGLCVGDLVLHLLRNAGQHLTKTVPSLLDALARRIAVAQSTIFTQTLCLPFAYLLTVELELTLDLLEAMTIAPSAQQTNGQARSGLEVVLCAWCNDAVDTVQGSYSIRVNDMAMSNLLACERPSVRALIVKGDMIVDEENRNTIMTRSRTRNNPHKFEMIPLHQRALKYLLAQLQNTEIAEAENAQDVDIAPDDGDDDWEEEDDLTKNEKDEMAWLSDMLGGGGGGWDDFENDLDGQDNDEDLMGDQIMQVDMANHITSVVRQAYVRNANDVQELCNRLTDIEKAVMSRKVLSM